MLAIYCLFLYSPLSEIPIIFGLIFISKSNYKVLSGDRAEKIYLNASKGLVLSSLSALFISVGV